MGSPSSFSHLFNILKLIIGGSSAMILIHLNWLVVFGKIKTGILSTVFWNFSHCSYISLQCVVFLCQHEGQYKYTEKPEWDRCVCHEGAIHRKKVCVNSRKKKCLSNITPLFRETTSLSYSLSLTLKIQRKCTTVMPKIQHVCCNLEAFSPVKTLGSYFWH